MVGLHAGPTRECVMTHPSALLKAFGLRASKKRGQNFLVQPATASAIARFLGAGPKDTVVEIGSGLGALTLALAGLAGGVVAVEIDRGVVRALAEILAEAGAGNVVITEQDALELDWAAIAQKAGGPVLVAGNLPYNISSPLLFKLLDNLDAWRSACFMVQKELAVRLAAEPGSRDYGRMAVLVKTFLAVEPGMQLGPDQFFPRPAVDSMVMRLRRLERPLVEFSGRAETELFRSVVKAAFSQRRKTLANSLMGGLRLKREPVASALEAAGVDGGRRAETLSPVEFGRVARALGDCRTS